MSQEEFDEIYETDEVEEEAFDDELDAEEEVVDTLERVPEEFREIARKYKANEPLTDAELDLVADTAIEILRSLLEFFGASEADIDEYDGGEGELILDVSNADLAILIGRHGKTLMALQSMFTLILNHRLGFRYPVMIDIESYKSRRRQKLETMAKNYARRAISRGSEVRMHPMKSYERRVVHLALRSFNGVTTHSEGTEPNRCVIIVPTKRRR